MVSRFRRAAAVLRTFWALALLALTAAASAHDFWLRPDTFTPAVNKPAALSLHVGDRFVSEKELAHQKKPTVSLKLFSAGDAVDLDAKDGDKPAVRFTPKKAGVYFVALERDA